MLPRTALGASMRAPCHLFTSAMRLHDGRVGARAALEAMALGSGHRGGSRVAGTGALGQGPPVDAASLVENLLAPLEHGDRCTVPDTWAQGRAYVRIVKGKSRSSAARWAPPEASSRPAGWAPTGGTPPPPHEKAGPQSSARAGVVSSERFIRVPYVEGRAPAFIQWLDLWWTHGGLPSPGANGVDLGGWCRLEQGRLVGVEAVAVLMEAGAVYDGGQVG